jgi:hypothetical protein
MVTHATGALSVPFIAWCSARRDLRSFAATLLRRVVPCVALGLAFVLALSLYAWVRPPTAPRGPRHPTPIHAAISELLWLLPGSRPKSLWIYLREMIVAPAAILLVLGLPGLVRLATLRTREGMPLLAWVVAFFTAGWFFGYVEGGGLFLPIYPALAVGAAETATVMLRAALRIAPGFRGAGPSLLVLLCATQGAIGLSRGVLPSAGPDPIRWVEALRRGTDSDGWLVTMEVSHASLVRRYGGPRVLSLAHVGLDPAPRHAEIITAIAAEVAGHARAGAKVYVDRFVPRLPEAATLFDAFCGTLRAQGDLLDASSGAFEAWRFVPR